VNIVFLAVPFPIAVALAAAAVAAVTDVWKFKVYNILTFPLLVTGLVYHGVTGGAAGLAASLLGAAAAFFLMIVLYVLGGMGAGDVKFLTALGAWLGLPITLYVFLAGCIVGGIYSAVLVVWASSMKEVFLNMQILLLKLASLGRHLSSEDRVGEEVARSDRRRRLVPFSAMMAVGLVATLVWIWSNSAEVLSESLPGSGGVSTSSVPGQIVPVADHFQPTTGERR
jgi:prepilin peptidase CpaA